jgi:protein TonB
MFDLTAESAQRPLRERSFRSSIVTIVAHAAGLAVLVAIPASRAINVQLDTPSIAAFVVPPDMLPPPLPTPAAPAAPARAAHAPSMMERAPAPIAPPIDIQPEPSVLSRTDPGGGVDGVEGGAPGGVIGGLVGGIEPPAPPPVPPPPRSPSRPVPLRTSGAIKPPDLLHRVEPVYSAIAAVSHISGVVILEAVVDVNGSVESVKVLRGSNLFLDNAAVDALKQWKYAPLVIAGLPTPFVVTVTFNFRLSGVRAAAASSP